MFRRIRCGASGGGGVIAPDEIQRLAEAGVRTDLLTRDGQRLSVLSNPQPFGLTGSFQ
jgi:hypothetical protein